jgi:hypothetical protein
MSHSKGLFAGTCPGNYSNYGRARERGGHMERQQKCSRCGTLRWKRVRRCFIFHDYQNSGKADHGCQKQKCSRCADKRETWARRCGFLTRHRFHKCNKHTGIHCSTCLATPR